MRTIHALAIVALWPLLTAGSCVSTGGEPVIKTVEVKVATPVYCNADVPERDHVDTDAALKSAPAAEDRYLLLAAGRLTRKAETNELRTALNGCRGPGR